MFGDVVAVLGEVRFVLEVLVAVLPVLVAVLSGEDGTFVMVLGVCGALPCWPVAWRSCCNWDWLMQVVPTQSLSASTVLP